VNTKFEGWIEKLHVDYSGKYVRKGEPLAEIYSPELLATQQEFLNLLKWKKESALVKKSGCGLDALKRCSIDNRRGKAKIAFVGHQRCSD